MSELDRKIYDKYLINTARDRDAINTAIEEGREERESKGKYEKENLSIRNAINKKGKLTYNEIAEMIEGHSTELSSKYVCN